MSYKVYKENTDIFLNWLGSTSGLPIDTTKNILLAAKSLVGTIPLPSPIKTALDVAIENRTAVREHFYKTDITIRGIKHQYFTKTLQEASTILSQNSNSTGYIYISQFGSGVFIVAKYGLPPAVLFGALHYAKVDRHIYNKISDLVKTAKETVTGTKKMNFLSFNPLPYFNFELNKDIFNKTLDFAKTGKNTLMVMNVSKITYFLSFNPFSYFNFKLDKKKYNKTLKVAKTGIINGFKSITTSKFSPMAYLNYKMKKGTYKNSLEMAKLEKKAVISGSKFTYFARFNPLLYFNFVEKEQ